ncbi:hypothetical protein PPL_06502 [Heterostelium album PN500]|uniref:Ankyrin repeat protein n=1 Tax=Heterostelium pallidum (strain ATCC 26659 / Pp 5 / PN500) TaxID=670386 RepID=D3BDB9_HETP5|nr:hypothetical protein PPL_06502 [Heterostelium album PN500]EFA80563.1 hypothetical protein PPL_06502 [Heterostelium album PN500]|eukprot:XP_020432683.1 hypothetical protein PPL_06502 [Heterostelium album PN500]
MIFFDFDCETTDFFNTLVQVAKLGYLSVLKWIHSNYPKLKTSESLIDHAVCSGNLELVEWINENRSEPCSSLAMDNAALYNHLKLLKWLHFNRSEGCSVDAMNFASRHNLQMVKWLHFNRSEGCTLDALRSAIIFNRSDIVKFLIENRSECYNEEAAKEIKLAISHSDYDIIQYFYQKFKYSNSDFTYHRELDGTTCDQNSIFNMDISELSFCDDDEY